ncbi:Tetratricopeptide repeat (TPR)-like superfamily protein [Striga hermonthica]|uniref:Tetratricopeptide repeat (TPR)-like superfamily protein n=1 Tax=Striga hermonthica TaxID=68872 RepID=A0A9N7R5D1_STRHE|nr:Tetratricopeptide repeat (TPR)-like superfamily protein [Striga hermonthica]
MVEDNAKAGAQGPSGDQNNNSVEATIETSAGCGATESTCNNNCGNSAESSAVTDGVEREKSLEYAEELMARGSKAAKEGDYGEATDCYSRALEIRVAHFGELAPECVNAYYKFGCALLYKAQEEADPLGSVPKKEGASQDDSNVDGSTKVAHAESSAASVSNKPEGGNDNCSNEALENIQFSEDEKGEEGEDESDDEELADGDEDESDLDLAWKMLDVARAIVEKHSGDTMEKVDILSALAEVALEREDVETSLSDYSKALSILERLVEPDSRLIAELNFRICLCLEIGSKPEEAIPYCQKAISVCKSRVNRLTEEAKNLSGSAETETALESEKTIQPSLSASISSSDSLAEKAAEIETLTGLCSELEKKLEDLQQLVLNPKSILSDILGIMSAKAKAAEKSALPAATSSSQPVSAGSTTSAAVSTTNGTNGASGVTHLGVVGRGVKRVVMSSTMQVGPAKKPAFDDPSNSGDGSSA